MTQIELKYGQQSFSMNVEPTNIKIIKSQENVGKLSQAELLQQAIENPIDSPRLKEIVKPSDEICIIVPDVTRLWQNPSVYLPYIIDELRLAGVQDSQIRFISALGTHRKQTIAEHKQLLGDALYQRFAITDHDCYDDSKLTYVGTTSFGTEVFVNKTALDCDHIIITGGIVFHELAGFGGGRKSIMPGISAYSTIMHNHALSLNPNGPGSNQLVKAAVMEGNPFNDDMSEAAAFVNPSFLFNVLCDSNGTYSAAVAGNYITAHRKGCEILKTIDSSAIREKADVVIVSCGSYPKDINLYQASKGLSNAVEATLKGGTIILLAECIEGLGHEDMEQIFFDYATNEEREAAIRKDYSIAKFMSFVFCEMAVNFNLILVSAMPSDLLSRININIVKTLDEALALNPETIADAKLIYLMPTGANTLPVLV